MDHCTNKFLFEPEARSSTQQTFHKISYWTPAVQKFLAHPPKLKNHDSGNLHRRLILFFFSGKTECTTCLKIKVTKHGLHIKKIVFACHLLHTKEKAKFKRKHASPSNHTVFIQLCLYLAVVIVSRAVRYLSTSIWLLYFKYIYGTQYWVHNTVFLIYHILLSSIPKVLKYIHCTWVHVQWMLSCT